MMDFNANTMRDLALLARKDLEDKEFQIVCDKINEAAKQGHFSLKVVIVFKTTINRLKRRGFKVEPYYPDCISIYQTGEYYEVSWNGDE